MENLGSEPVSKHERLSSAITDIESISSHVNDLLDRIRGSQPTAKAEVPKRQNLTLLEVLESGPDAIKNSLTSAHSLLDELSNLLF